MNQTSLPANWRTVRLGEHCHKPEYGLTTSATSIPSAPKFLRITDIQEEGVNWDAVPYCESTEDLRESQKLLPGDVVIARIGATTGKAYVIRQCPDAVFASYLIRVRTKPELLPEFLGFYLQTEDYWKQIDQNKGGRLKGGVNIPILQNLTLPLPTLSEQHAIARALRTVQEAREARRQELQLERERKAALMQHLFTHGTRGNIEAQRKTRFGQVPADWREMLLSECALVQTGAAKGRKFGDSKTINVPYLRVANVQDGYLDLAEIKYISIRESEVERYKLRHGDVVLTEGGDFDKLGRGFVWKEDIPNCIHQNHVFAVRVNREFLMPDFFSYLTQSQYGKAYFLSVAHRTTNLACINSAKLKAFPVLVPNIEEQEAIIKVLELCDAKLSAIEQEVSLLGELFRAMLEELMTGRLSATALLAVQ